MKHSITSMPRERRIRALTVGLSASVAVLLMTVVVAEPMQTFADTEDVVVSVTLASALGLACDANNDNINGSGETLNLGTITYSGDTGAYSDSRAAKCRVSTNNATGYTLGWRVLTGSGGSMTGHLINQNENIIAAFGTGSASNYTKAWELPLGTNDSRWGGRVSSTSSGSNVGSMDFGTDSSSEKWARVSTGSSVTIRQSNTQSQSGSGDLIKVGFRVQVGATKIQPSGTYRTTVTFTAAAQ